MIAEPDQTVYTDADLQVLADNCLVPDTEDRAPDEDGYITTYDLNAVASIVWDMKASAIADEFTFSADGGTYQRSQKFEQYIRQANHYRSLSVAYTKRLKQTPKETSTYGDQYYQDWIDDYENRLT
jgi:hypothetical protein